MELVSRIEELDQRITNNVSDLRLEDMDLIKNTLAMDQNDATVCQLQEIVVELVIFLKDSHLSFLDDETVEILFKLMFKDSDAVFRSVVRLFAKLKSDKLDELVKNHLETTDKADKASVNLAILNTKHIDWRNKELKLLNSLENNLITLNVLRTYKAQITKSGMEVLYAKLRRREPIKVFYKIFAEINEVLRHKNAELMDCNVEHDEDYLCFMHSLMVDEETYMLAYEKLYVNGFFSSLFNALQSLSKLHRIEEKAILPEDIAYIEVLMKIINKLVDKKYSHELAVVRSKFYSFVDVFVEVLSIKLPLSLKKLIYEILGQVSGAEEVNRKIQDFLNSGYVKRNAHIDFEYERLCDNFDCTSQLLFLCLGLSYVPDLLEFATYVLSSENPRISVFVLRIFRALKFKNMHGNMHKYLREACYKDGVVAQEVVDYCIDMNYIISSVELTKAVMAVESNNFFEYVTLFKDFSIYLNPDFLNRLLDSKVEGLRYLGACNEEIVRFVTMNRPWFNSFVKREDDVVIKKLVLEMYSNMVSISKRIDFSFTDESRTILPQVYCAALFRIFSSSLLHCFYNNIDFKEYILPDQVVGDEDLEEYCTYVKCKIVVGADANIGFMTQNYSGRFIDDLVAFSRPSGDKTSFEPLSLRSRVLEGKKDNSIFAKNYESSPRFERYIMFNIIDVDELQRNYAMRREFERIIKAEFGRLRIEGLTDKENVLLAQNCLAIILLLENIDAIVRIIDDIPRIPESLVNLVVAACVKNLCNGGTSYVRSVMRKGNADMQARLLLMLFVRNLWTPEMASWADALRKNCRNNENLAYLFESLKN